MYALNAHPTLPLIQLVQLLNNQRLRDDKKPVHMGKRQDLIALTLIAP